MKDYKDIRSRGDHNFGIQIIRKLEWCREEKKKISCEALVNWMVKRNTTQARGEELTRSEVKFEIGKLYEIDYIVDYIANKNKFLKLQVQRRSLKYPLDQYSVGEAIKLTAIDYLKRRNEEIEKTPVKRPLKDYGYDIRRASLFIRKRALINYISKRRRDFHPEIVEKIIDEMIKDETLLVEDPDESNSMLTFDQI